jgi:multidrug resistance efflux pump
LQAVPAVEPVATLDDRSFLWRILYAGSKLASQQHQQKQQQQQQQQQQDAVAATRLAGTYST